MTQNFAVTLHLPGWLRDWKGYEVIAMTGHRPCSDNPLPVNVAMLSQRQHEYDRGQLLLFGNYFH